MLELGLFLTCFLAGVVNSVAGGGILVVFPALLATGMAPITANATSFIVSWPGALSSAFGYRKYLRELPAKYLLLLIPCVTGAIIGAYMLTHTTHAEFSQAVPWLVLTAVGLFIFQPMLHKHFEGNLKEHKNAPLLIVGLALLPMSVYGGYFGAGFGFLMLAFLGLTSLTNLHQINGLKNLAGATIAIIGTIYFGASGLIDWRFVPVMVTGSLIGGFVGSHFAPKVNPRLVHNFIILLGLIVSFHLFIRQ
jgi:uncharacterized membrane protein YfcA